MTKPTVGLLSELYRIFDKYRPFMDGPGMDRKHLELMDSEILATVRAWMPKACT